MRPSATPIALMDGEQLVALLVEKEVGVVQTSVTLLELSDLDLTAGGDG